MSKPVVSLIAPGSEGAPAALDRCGVRRVPPGDPRAEAVVVVGGAGVVRAVAAPQGPPILALLDKPDRRSAIRALDAGADAVLGRDASSAQLLAALEAIRAGLVVFPRQPRGTASSALTLRQQEILSLVVLGLSNAEIAKRLYLTESTIKSHLNSAFRKLEVRSRGEAVAKLLDPDSEYASGVVGLASFSAGGGGYKGPSVKS